MEHGLGVDIDVVGDVVVDFEVNGDVEVVGPSSVDGGVHLHVAVAVKVDDHVKDDDDARWITCHAKSLAKKENLR